MGKKKEARPLLNPKPYKRIPPLIYQIPTLIYIFKQKNPRNQSSGNREEGKRRKGLTLEIKGMLLHARAQLVFLRHAAQSLESLPGTCGRRCIALRLPSFLASGAPTSSWFMFQGSRVSRVLGLRVSRF
jgi:hypothetical protein